MRQLQNLTDQVCILYQVEPLKQENARLVRENNELHQQIIQVKEEAKQRENQYMLHLKSVEGQTQDLKFVNEQG